ncbi:MAG: hypothetical protein LAT51_09255 [Flavobacteriaceae bacterium]|nr:hypothetical protein [Flavobacteriaceae bacterium]
MRKVLLLVALSISIQFINAQEKPMSIDALVGAPLGDIGDVSNLFLGANFTYMFAELDENLHIGGRAGYSVYLGEDTADVIYGEIIESEGIDFDFITLAGVARYDFNKVIFGRIDFGYAISLESTSDNAVFIEPRVGYTNSNLDLFAFYQNLFFNNNRVNAIGVGFAYKF